MKKPTITYDDFDRLDLRAGLVKSVESVADSKKLLALMVDFGSELGEIEILAGLKEYFREDNFINKTFVFLVNLEPKPMGGKISNGMILAADIEGNPQLIPLSPIIAPGSIIR